MSRVRESLIAVLVLGISGVWIGGCAGAPAKKSDYSAPPSSQPRHKQAPSKQKVREKRDADKGAGEAMEPSPMRPSTPTTGAPAEAKEEGTIFEGDTFDGPTAREQVDALVADIEENLPADRRDGGVAEDYEAEGPESCEEVCDLSEAICESSAKICNIADRAPDEPYFAERCDWSRDECRVAGDRCSTCSG